jgi:hypothetical protein
MFICVEAAAVTFDPSDILLQSTPITAMSQPFNHQQPPTLPAITSKQEQQRRKHVTFEQQPHTIYCATAVPRTTPLSSSSSTSSSTYANDSEVTVVQSCTCRRQQPIDGAQQFNVSGATTTLQAQIAVAGQQRTVSAYAPMPVMSSSSAAGGHSLHLDR